MSIFADKLAATPASAGHPVVRHPCQKCPKIAWFPNSPDEFGNDQVSEEVVCPVLIIRNGEKLRKLPTLSPSPMTLCL